MRDMLFPRWCAAVFTLVPLAEILHRGATGQTFYACVLATLLLAMLCAALTKIVPHLYRFQVYQWVLALCALYPLTRSASKFITFLWETAFPTRNAWVVVAFCVVSIFVLAQARFLRCAMWAYPIAICGIIMVVISLLLTIPQMMLSYMEAPTFAALGETGDFFFAMLPSAVVLTLAMPEPMPASVARGLTVGGCLLAFCSLRTALIIGSHTASLLAYPNFSTAGLASFGGVGQHGEVFLAAFLGLCEIGKCVMLTCVVLHPVWDALDRLRKTKAKAA